MQDKTGDQGHKYNRWPWALAKCCRYAYLKTQIICLVCGISEYLSY